MSAQVRWDGLRELRAALRTMPADLTSEAGPIVSTAADRAASAIVARYPRRSGRLANSVSVVESSRGAHGVSRTVRVMAPHSHIYERGSKVRRTSTGAHRGSMPAANTAVPILVRERQRMYGELKDLLRREGLSVTGEP